MSDSVALALAKLAYSRAGSPDLSEIRAFAAAWIKHHKSESQR